MGNITRKCFVIWLSLALVATIITISVPINVDAKASPATLYVGGFGSGNYSTIQSAITAANSGDTIFVYDGIYEENPLINKSINLVGESNSGTIIDGSGYPYTIWINTSNVNITNLSILNATGNGINVSCSNIQIIDCLIYNNTRNGIWVNFSSEVTVYKCSIYNNLRNGIMFHGSDNNTVTYNNILQNTDYGIYLNKSLRNYVHHNNFIINNITGTQGVDNFGLNQWNDTAGEGNYWSNYSILYPFAKSDGYVWDTSYDLNGGSGAKDYYPLAYPVEFLAPVILDSTAGSGTTGDSFSFNCNVTDATNVSAAHVFYWFGSDIGNAKNLTLSYNSGTLLWEREISNLPSDRLEHLKYNLSAVDPNHNWASTGVSMVSISDNDPPAADAGDDVEIYLGDTVAFNGTDSEDNIKITNYTWRFTYNGEEKSWYNLTWEYKFGIAGDYIVTLKVFDAAGFNDTDTIWVNVTDSERPRINSVNYPANVNIGETIEVSILIYDASGFDLVKMNYIDINDELHNVSMNQQSTNDWNYTIFGQPTTGEVTFYIWVIDTFGNWNKSMIYGISILDNLLPEISEVQYQKKCKLNHKIEILAVVDDNCGLSEVRLNYTGVNQTNYNVSMAGSRAVNYTYSIPAQPQAGSVSFYIWVLDINNNRNRTEEHIITIEATKPSWEPTPPRITWLSSPAVIKVNEAIDILVNVFDESEVLKVYLNFTNVEGSIHNVTMIPIEKDNYSYTISPQPLAGYVILSVIAVDNYKIWNKTASRTIEVIEIIDDIYPPYVASTTPENNSVNVSIGTGINIYFNESMNSTNVAMALKITPSMNYTLSWRDNNIILKLVFQDNLSYDTTYIFTISVDATDFAGNALIKPFILTFKTQVPPAKVKDSDGDNMPDWWEEDNNLDPNDPNDAYLDDDNDDLTNYEEYLNQTSAFDNDTDNDGMLDGWEVKYGLDPLSDDANYDFDSDSYSNLEEYLGNSDPVNADSIPKSEDIEDQEDYMFMLIAIIILIIIIIILLMILIKRFKRSAVEEAELEEEGEEKEEEE